MGLKGKLVAEFEVRSSADDFHRQYRHEPHHISAFCNIIQAVELHDGEFGQPGSVICWHYTESDGKKCTMKEVVQFDDANNTTTFEAIEGDFAEDYKSLVITLQCEARGDGNTDLVKWFIDYERLREDSPHPLKLLEVLLIEGRHVEAEHVKNASAPMLPKVDCLIVS